MVVHLEHQEIGILRLLEVQTIKFLLLKTETVIVFGMNQQQEEMEQQNLITAILLTINTITSLQQRHIYSKESQLHKHNSVQLILLELVERTLQHFRVTAPLLPY